MKKENQLKLADVVKSNIMTFNSLGGVQGGRVTTSTKKMFDGYGIIITPVDHEYSDPTCAVMLASGKIVYLKETRLEKAF